MRYNIKLQSPEWYAMCECMDITDADVPKIVEAHLDDGYGIYDIQFIVGGVELDFTKVLNRLYDKHEMYVENEAKAIVKQKYESLFTEIDVLKEKVEWLTKKTSEDWE